MKVVILAVGKLKENYFREAEAEYLKRLSAYCDISIIELPDSPIPANAGCKIESEIKEKEGERILSKLKPSDYLLTLDMDQKEYDSKGFAVKFDKTMALARSNLHIAIGGSLGLGENVRKRANDSLSLSKMTLTHQMCRIFLLEQIYRSFRINRNEPYDK